MRKLLLTIALALCAVAAQAQYTTNPFLVPTGSQLLLPDGTAAAPALGWSNYPGYGFSMSSTPAIFYSYNSSYRMMFLGDWLRLRGTGMIQWAPSSDVTATHDLALIRDAANTLALRNAGTAGTPVPQTFNVYNFCDGTACATGYERGTLSWSGSRFTIDTDQAGTGVGRDINLGLAGISIYSQSIYPSATDARDLGASTLFWSNVYLSRSIQGSKSKALTDNTATAFVRLSVADDDYEACAFGWTAYAEDTATDARQVTKNRTNVAILNNSGTEACNFSATADDVATLATAGTLTCTFDCNSASADTVDLRATCDTSLAATTTLTFEYRLDCESTLTVTPQ